jgi:hypothetical protein
MYKKTPITPQDTPRIHILIAVLNITHIMYRSWNITSIYHSIPHAHTKLCSSNFYFLESHKLCPGAPFCKSHGISLRQNVMDPESSLPFPPDYTAAYFDNHPCTTSAPMEWDSHESLLYACPNEKGCGSLTRYRRIDAPPKENVNRRDNIS